jgi:DNA polymerase III subunit chi
LRVDFYQLSQTPVEGALPQLAVKMLDAGARVLVVSGDEVQQARISAGLWAVKDHFLAHASAGGDHDARQPILLASSLDAPNGATYLALADGVWRDGAEGFERVFLLFDGSTIDDARAIWRKLGELDAIERNYWRQEDGRWTRAG